MLTLSSPEMMALVDAIEGTMFLTTFIVIL